MPVLQYFLCLLCFTGSLSIGKWAYSVTHPRICYSYSKPATTNPNATISPSASVSQPSSFCGCNAADIQQPACSAAGCNLRISSTSQCGSKSIFCSAASGICHWTLVLAVVTNITGLWSSEVKVFLAKHCNCMQHRHHPACVLSIETAPLVDITLICCWEEKVFQNGLCFVKVGNLLTGVWRIQECVLHKICVSILSDSTRREVGHPKWNCTLVYYYAALYRV